MQQALELLKSAGLDIETYLENPLQYQPEYFESVKDAIADAISLLEKPQ